MSRPHRLTADAYAGTHAYFLTICTHRRRRLFQGAEVVDLVTVPLLQTADRESFEILAYCFMPDHLHAVVVGCGEAANLPRLVRVAKQRSGFHYTRTFGGRLWQESYFDRTIRRDEALIDVLRYVVTNPIRAGLVNDAMAYPFWGSSMYSREAIVEAIGDPCPGV